MSNHVHMLVTPSAEGAASALMKRVNQRFAQVRNEERGGSGKLFEQSFESEPIANDKHLAAAVMYVDANPHVARMRNAHAFRWSSYQAHAGEKNREYIDWALLSPDAWYLSLGTTATEREAAYRSRFQVYLEAKLAQQDEAECAYARAGRLLRPDGSSAAERVFTFAPKRLVISEE